MPGPHPVYRSLVRLYPKEFRGRNGDDVVQHFADLVADRGVRSAWARTGLDLIVTVPRYRLESIMTEQQSATTISVAIALLAAGGVAGVLIDLYPASLALLLLVAALALALAQRSTLARAIRTPDSNRRRIRLRLAAVLAVIFVASYVRLFNPSKDHWAGGEQLLIAIGSIAMVGAIVFLVAALLTPRSPDKRAVTPAA